ncbi:hypothetical protein BaRGS_00000378 [Batillaria attramentaria]|uniref:Glycosyltransferase n=1 Tax=Batillaria attramentaria TaxID=370345 RepID=A0ABD0M8J6_9CAEN
MKPVWNTAIKLAHNLSRGSAHQCPQFPRNFPVHDSFFPCDWRSTVPPSCNHRLRAQLSCSGSSVDILYEWVSADTPPAAYSFSDECLRRVTKERCSEDKDLIPKLVHFVTFRGREMPFYSFLAVLSTVRFVQPCLVLFHADSLPSGLYWDTLLRMVSNIVHVNRTAPTVIFGHKVEVVEHQADIARLEAVKTFGGLYIDTDYLVLNPIDNLRNYTVVMGNTIPNYNYANGVFMGRAGAEFFDLWYHGYRTFSDSVWGYHSTILPYELHKQFPNVPFHAVDTFMRPYFKDIGEKFFKKLFDWEGKHGIHLYVRLFKKYFSGLMDFERQNSSLGLVSRHILFGDRQACFGGLDATNKLARMETK